MDINTPYLQQIAASTAYTQGVQSYLQLIYNNAAYHAANNYLQLQSIGNYISVSYGLLQSLMNYLPPITTYLHTIAMNSYLLNQKMNSPTAYYGYADGGIASGPLSGYPAMLHGTEAIIPLKNGAVPVQLSSGAAAGGYNDPETKSLLRELVAQGRQKQRVTLALDNGKELSGYIRSEADTVRVSANERKGVSRRRLYN